ncbi:LacI family DNA-binding transcriptional regulator [Humibacter ginsenosidimutans]|uniref:LacI family DNA-binding transcriptional regulator n=1 Tax=Humibacter ginsenosidimutans TaxID=2599293 RepID=UPI001AF02325|nr:LacI family DNA-binding transcriptional regulator [Humibacter ginsenosidimutans]
MYRYIIPSQPAMIAPAGNSVPWGVIVSRRVTLKDIADEAGVSIMTVSNSLNGKRGKVSESTIERIEQIARRRGYVPSASARSLAADSSKLIGLLVPAEANATLALSPYNVEVFGVLERELRGRGYHVLFRGVSTAEEVDIALRSWNLDGAILLGFPDRGVERVHPPANTTIVALDSYASTTDAIEVRSDDFQGGRLAAAHLLTQGHRRILFAGPDIGTTGVIHERFAGFIAAFGEADAEWDPADREEGESTYEAGIAIGRELTSRHPAITAVFATADVLAIGIIEGLREQEIAVPKDVSVVGFDNLDVDNYITPKLTSIDQDVYTKALNAAQLLLTAIEGQTIDQPITPCTSD